MITAGTEQTVDQALTKDYDKPVTHLQSPGNAERSHAASVGAYKRDEVLGTEYPGRKEPRTTAQVKRGFFPTKRCPYCKEPIRPQCSNQYLRSVGGTQDRAKPIDIPKTVLSAASISRFCGYIEGWCRRRSRGHDSEPPK